ncbi:MAG: right-handed parallel beta-helix repeat-containing protein [Thermodesulfobacteriota bacterium]
MPRKLVLVILLGLVLLSSATALADGDFYPGGPLGTRITSLPYTISAPGSYYLGGNLSYTGGDGITIASDHVTLDLMGFTITGPGSTNCGIYMNGRKNVEIRNGTVSSWGHGILEEGYLTALGHRVINVRAVGNFTGVLLYGKCHLIKNCRATAGSPSKFGLHLQYRGTISGCATYNFSDHGIGIDGYGTISGNIVIGPGGTCSTEGVGIWAGVSTLVLGNEVTDAPKGIYCYIGLQNIISNTVTANSGQIGIEVPTDMVTLLDQNSVKGEGTHYQGVTTGVTVLRHNAD